ncbi:MAG: ABC transporter ATP-binding protein [Acholeplasmatales bacterium]|nr:ABC transporter ATP-binding protein [Acholeplasmatales bacterium]
MENKIIECKNVSKSFAHNGGQIHVLSNINLDIYQNDFTVIMGTSGSGKSTLLYAISGMDKATSGSVLYNGKDINNMKEKELTNLRHKDFGFVFQQMHLVSNLSLYENVCISGYLNKDVKATDVKEYADSLFERMGINDVKTHLPSQVSGGQQQRCAIARAVINKPSVIFADEPTGALNKRNSIDVLDLLSSLNNDGQAIVMVTHDIRGAIRADRILYLSDGNIVGELRLNKYKKEDEKSREAQINAWLNSLEW